MNEPPFAAHAAEDALDALAREACHARGESDWRRIENEAIAILEPFGRRLIRRAAPGPTPWAEDVKMSHFRFFALDQWRRRVADGAPRMAFDPDEALTRLIVDFLGRARPASEGGSRRERRREKRDLEFLYLPPYGGFLGDLPPTLFAKVLRHPDLPPVWREALSSLREASAEFFDPGRGGYLPWLLCRFRKRLWDFVLREEHAVRRCAKTDAHRREGRGDAGWGYRAVECGDLSEEASDARLELDSLLGRVHEEDRRFLGPLLRHAVDDLRGLAVHWRISPAAVSKRMKRIRLALAA